MASRKLKVVVVDDNIDYLEICSKFIARSNALKDIDFEPIYYLVNGKSAEKVVGELRDFHPDQIVIDHNLGSTTGKVVADLYRKHERIPVIYSSSYSPGDFKKMGVINTYTKVTESMTGLVEGTIDGFFNKDPSAGQDLGEIIRRFAFKPLDVSLEGIGQFNSKLLQEFLKSPAIRTIKFHSSSKQSEDLFEWCEEPRADCNESRISKSKLVWCDKLDNLLDTDILTVATASLNPEDMQKIPYSNDRREFFQYELPRLQTLATIVKEKNPRILNFTYSNPVPYLLEYMRRFGLPANTLASPFEPDTSRLKKALYHVLGAEYADEFIEESGLIAAGVHGEVRGVFPMKENTHVVEYRDILQKAEDIANEAGKKSQRAAIKLRLPYFLPQTTNFPPFEDLAHYRQFPTSCHTHWEYEWKGKRYNGYAAGPVKTSWRGGITIAPDEEAVERIGRNELYAAISPMLDEQRMYLNEQLPSELSVNV